MTFTIPVSDCPRKLTWSVSDVGLLGSDEAGVVFVLARRLPPKGAPRLASRIRRWFS